MRRIKLVGVVALVLVTSMAVGAGRAEAQWDYNVGFYLWALGLDGEMTVMGQTADADVPFSDIFDDLQFAFSVHVEAHNQKKWTIFGDVYYAQLGSDLDQPQGEYDADMGFVELGGAYRTGQEFDAIFGLRYITMDILLRIDPQLPLPLPPPSIKAGDEASFTDLFIGGRWIKTFGKNDKWTFRGRFDGGGFGLTDGSDLMFNVQLLFDRQMSRRTGLIFGWRWFDLDYEDTDIDFGMDVTMSGPVLAFRFGN